MVGADDPLEVVEERVVAPDEPDKGGVVQGLAVERVLHGVPGVLRDQAGDLVDEPPFGERRAGLARNQAGLCGKAHSAHLAQRVHDAADVGDKRQGAVPVFHFAVLHDVHLRQRFCIVLYGRGVPRKTGPVKTIRAGTAA